MPCKISRLPFVSSIQVKPVIVITNCKPTQYTSFFKFYATLSTF
jgi:hypothetical protein